MIGCRAFLSAQKKTARCSRSGASQPKTKLVLSALGTHDREAIAAVNGAVGFGLEGHASFLAAAGANGGEILTGTTGRILTSVAAGLAALGLILEAALSVELPQIDVVKFQSQTPLLDLSVVADPEDENNENDDDP